MLCGCSLQVSVSCPSPRQRGKGKRRTFFFCFSFWRLSVATPTALLPSSEWRKEGRSMSECTLELAACTVQSDGHPAANVLTRELYRAWQVRLSMPPCLRAGCAGTDAHRSHCASSRAPRLLPSYSVSTLRRPFSACSWRTRARRRSKLWPPGQTQGTAGKTSSQNRR